MDLPPLRALEPPRFAADVVISLDGEARPVLSVSVSIPHVELQWIKLVRGYACGAELTVVFQPRRGGRALGDVWERRLLASSFESTIATNRGLVERRSFNVPSGRYQLRIQVRDLNSGLVSTAREEVEIPDYSKVPVGFVDLELGTADSTGAFIAVPARRYGLNAGRIASRVALFDRRPGEWPREYPFRYRISSESNGEILAGVRRISLARSGEAVVLRPDSCDLFIGDYVFEVELVEGRSRWRVERSFEVEESGPPRGTEFQKILEPLALIASPGEIEHLRSLRPEEQARGWEEFWKRRDPTPETPRNEAMLEFFRRVRYAERHFQSYGPSWRSDMGRVYIKFGAPDQVDSRPATTREPQLEIWYYNQPYRRFVFADRDGFGRYVLISPSLE